MDKLGQRKNVGNSMDNSKISITKRESYFLAFCVIMASSLMILTVLIQSYRHEIFGTTLLLGWDSSGYVWLAEYVISEGPIHMMTAWNYPHLYVQLLALLGYLAGDVVMIERILPLAFGIFLVCINSKLVLRVSENVYIACLTAFLTALSINVLRILSDLNRNLMAFSLSFAAFLLVPNLANEGLITKKYVLFILFLFTIASTHFETYVILALSLLLYGVLSGKFRNLLTLVFALAIPVAVLISIFPAYFFGYMSTVVIFQDTLIFEDIILWTGGSSVLVIILFVGSYLFYKLRSRSDKLAMLVFSWCFIIFAIVVLIGPFNREFALRALHSMPTPLLFGLAISGYKDHLKNWRPEWALPYSRKNHSIEIKLSHLLLGLTVLVILVGSAFVVIQNCGEFLTPFVSYSNYEKIVEVKEYFLNHNLSVPIVIFRGEPPVRLVSLFRNYLGAEIGEHFAYYGEISNLLRLAPSQPEIDSSVYPFRSQLERYFITYYYDELVGNISGPPPFLYCHDSHVTNATLMSHPILIVTPDFYNETIPYYVKPFYVDEGIYVIPPNSISPSGIAYGPEVTIVKNSTPTQVRSEYYPSPSDPSILYLQVNGSSGCTSYNFTTLPSDWVFVSLEQGGDVSFPEKNPKRINGTKALIGNDPADSLTDWAPLGPEQNGTLETDMYSKKEGSASLKVSGKTDSWGCLSVKYDSAGTWNLSGYSSIGVWAKCNESAIFSISLVNSDESFRTFWCLKAEEDSVTAGWKRFVANLTDWFSQTPEFNIGTVDRLYLYVYSDVGKSLSFWIDDLTIDTAFDLEGFIYKDRVLVGETVVAYFCTCVESG